MGTTPAAGESRPAHREAQPQSTADLLTGIANEQAFRQRLPEEFRRARERETNAALLLLRLDDLPDLNARHGRLSGDDAVRALAYLLDNHRSEPGCGAHQVYRLGGPVFAYYAPDCSAPQARSLAERIHERAQQSDLYIEPLRVSIGLVDLYEFFLEEGTARQLAGRIEQAALDRLRVAEQQGANTICDTSSADAAAPTAARTVLLVEPEPASLELLVHALRAAGLTVIECQDGESAMSLVQAAAPGVILCEAMTPRLNGFAIRERLRANAVWSAIPFILMSHRKDEELVRKAVALDIRHYFRKPISVTEVGGLVVNLTRRGAEAGAPLP